MLKYLLPLIFKLRPSWVYKMARHRIAGVIPLNSLLGIEIESVGEGTGVARLPFHPEITNHISTVHATAIFGVAEAASGCAMTGALAPAMLGVRPVAVDARVHFMKAARSTLIAEARSLDNPQELRARLESEGKINFDVSVTVRDEAGKEIADITVTWHVTRKSP